MLEIFIIALLAKRIASNASAKGLPSGRYVFGLIALWILGEAVGFGAFSLLKEATYLSGGESLLWMIICSWTGGAAGAAAAFALVRNARNRFFDEDEDLMALGLS